MVSAAFFTGMEIALISCDRTKLKKLGRTGNRSASLALILLDNISSLLTSTQLGTNLSIALATTIATILSTNFFGIESEWTFVLILIPSLLLLCDSFPKLIARNYSLKISLKGSYLLFFIHGLFIPISGILTLYTDAVSNLFGVDSSDAHAGRQKSKEDVYRILDVDPRDTDIKIAQKRMIRNILDFSDSTVRSAMVPLVKVDAISADATIKESVELFEDLHHSRLPVYEDRVDNIVGILHFVDIFYCKKLNDKVRNYMKAPTFVTEHQHLEALVEEMKTKDIRMAIALDEYGGAVGIITKEDVIEEVVGDVVDEFDEDNLVFHEISENVHLVYANIELDDFNERLNISIPEGDYETLSGFLLQKFNRIPKVGEELTFESINIRVYKATHKGIQSVIVKKIT